MFHYNFGPKAHPGLPIRSQQLITSTRESSFRGDVRVRLALKSAGVAAPAIAAFFSFSAVSIAERRALASAYSSDPL